MDKTLEGRAGIIVASTLFLVMGLYASIQGIRTAYLASTSENWTAVDARVIRSEIRHEWNKSKSDFIPWPVVAYEYTVDGERQESDRFTFKAYQSSHHFASNMLARYPTNHIMTVYHHPNRRNLAVIKPGSAPESYLGLYYGAILLGIGGLLGAYARHLQSQKSHVPPN